MKYNLNCIYFSIQSWLDSIKQIFIKKELPGPVVIDNLENYIDFTELRNYKKLYKHNNITDNDKNKDKEKYKDKYKYTNKNNNENQKLNKSGNNLNRSSCSLYYSCNE